MSYLGSLANFSSLFESVFIIIEYLIVYQFIIQKNYKAGKMTKGTKHLRMFKEKTIKIV